MIQFDKDGVTLFYIDANGQRVAHNYLEGAAYSAMLAIRSAQQAAATENAQAVLNYNNVLKNDQLSIDSRGDVVGITIPTKPLQKVVSDVDGSVTRVPFVPALADLVLPVTKPVTGISTSAPAAASREDQMYGMISAMFHKEFPDA